MKRPLISFILVAVALVFAACSSTPVRRSFKEGWKDTLTAEKIRYKLMKDKDVHKARMHVTVFRGQVTLTGRATTETEKARAEHLAKSVKRVTGVENYVHVVGDGKTAPAVAQGGKTNVPLTADITGITPEATNASARTRVGIEEKVLVTEKVKVTETVSEDDVPVVLPTVPTVRVGTGSGQSVTTVAGPSRAIPAAATKGAAKSAARTVRPATKDTKLVTVKKIPSQTASTRVTAPAVAREAPLSVPKAPIAATSPAVPKETPAEAAMSAAPTGKVVGKSKTGLPWDGEVYEDDASSMKSSVTAARQPAAISSPAKAPPAAPAPNRSPGQAPAQAAPVVPTGDDLAREAAQELEKLRSKH